MRSIKLKLGLVFVAALAFSIATTASAAASGFLASTKAKLLATKVAVQVFVTSEGSVECSEVKIVGGESPTTEAASLLIAYEYAGCMAFGFIPQEISNADYLLLADGAVDLDKLLVIRAIGCEVSLPVQSTLTTKYVTVGNNIELLPTVTGIHYTASKCSSNGSFTNGTFKGNSEIMIASGTLSFMP